MTPKALNRMTQLKVISINLLDSQHLGAPDFEKMKRFCLLGCELLTQKMYSCSFNVDNSHSTDSGLHCFLGKVRGNYNRLDTWYQVSTNHHIKAWVELKIELTTFGVLHNFLSRITPPSTRHTLLSVTTFLLLSRLFRINQPVMLSGSLSQIRIFFKRDHG